MWFTVDSFSIFTKALLHFNPGFYLIKNNIPSKIKYINDNFAKIDQ